MKTFLPLIVLAISFLPTTLQAQSGWTRQPKSFYAQLSYAYFGSTNFYNLAGEQLETNRFEQQSINFYGEYGLTPRLTFILSMPLFRLNRFEVTEWAYGIGDLQIQAKYALTQGKFPISLIIAPELPTAPGDNFASNKLIPLDRVNLPTGDGEFNVWSYVAGSHSFYPIPLYASFYGGYNFRTAYNGRDFRNQFSVGVEAGYTFKEKLTLKGSIRGLKTQGDQPTRGDFIRSDGTSFSAWSVGLFYKLNKDLRLLVDMQNYFGGIISNRNIYASPTLSVGMAFER